MKQSIASLLLMPCLLTAPLLAQTTIGGGVCNSGSLNGVYAITITGRQVSTAAVPAVAASKSHLSASGTFISVLQANGSATFDGLNKVTIGLVANTAPSIGATLSWSGTYSVQANCAAVVNVTTGASATLNVAIYNSGADFLLSGSDATYTYSGNGNAQPAGCSASTFSGVYTFSGAGFALNGSAISGAEDGTGLMQFDGVSQVTVNVAMATVGAAPGALTLTGSYTISSNCQGSATLTDTSANSYTMTFSIYNSSVANAAAFVGLARGAKFLVTGNAHAAYGQPAPSAALHRFEDALAPLMAVRRTSGSANRGGRA